PRLAFGNARGFRPGRAGLDGLGFLTGLGFGVVAGLLLVLLALGALLVWPRRRPPAPAGGAPAATPDLAITATERFLNALAVDQLRAFHLPVGTLEDVILDLKPGQE